MLSKKELKLHQDATAYYICVKRFSKKFAKDKNYQKEAQEIVYVI